MVKGYQIEFLATLYQLRRPHPFLQLHRAVFYRKGGPRPLKERAVSLLAGNQEKNRFYLSLFLVIKKDGGQRDLSWKISGNPTGSSLEDSAMVPIAPGDAGRLPMDDRTGSTDTLASLK